MADDGRRAASSSAPMPVSDQSARRVSFNYDSAYLKTVEDVFKDNMEKYDDFLDIMLDYQARRFDIVALIARVKELFRGHRDLTRGFNNFLSEGCEIVLPEEPPDVEKMYFDPEEAINFLNKMSRRFRGDVRVFESFEDIMKKYENTPPSQVYPEVAALFKDHPDLLEEITKFLPES